MAITRRDNGLLFLLVGLNTVSGVSTVIGATYILPFSIALVAGLLSQTVLLTLLSGLIMKRAPLRKWISALFFASLCVYASFFTYWKIMTDEKREEISLSKAISKYSEFENKNLGPIRDKLSKVKEELKRLDKLLVCENKDGCTSGRGGGRGEWYRKLQVDRENQAAIVSKYEEQLNLIERKKNKIIQGRTLQQLSTTEIFNLSNSLYALIPGEFSKEIPSSPRREDYFMEELDELIIAPVYMLRAGEPSAYSAMGLAIGFDGIILLLMGTAVVTKASSSSSLRNLANIFLISPITSVKEVIAEILNAINKPPIIQPTQSEIEELENALDVVRRTGISISPFLYGLLNMTNNKTHTIDLSNIMVNESSPKMAVNYKILYRSFLNTMATARVGWVTEDSNGESWKIKSDCQGKYNIWLSDSRNHYSRLDSEPSSKKISGRMYNNTLLPPVLDGTTSQLKNEDSDLLDNKNVNNSQVINITSSSEIIEDSNNKQDKRTDGGYRWFRGRQN